MRISIDTKPLFTGHAVRGVGSYVKNLVAELKNVKRVELVNASDAELIHYPYFDLFFRTLKVKSKPVVVTVYDTIPLLYPKQHPPGIKGKLNFFFQKRELRKVAAIITISDTSKKDIVKYLGVHPDKVFPIHLAASDIFKPAISHQSLVVIQKKYNLPKSFVLYVGDVNYNKNLINLLDACKELAVTLAIVGKQAAKSDFDQKHKENQPLVKLLEKYGKDKGVMRLGFVPDDDLIKIYNLAAVYCQPSLYEGFGLPLLEAQACGTPVVATDIPAHREIAGDSVLYVEPKNIATGLRKVLRDKKIMQDLAKSGLENSKRFSWSKTAQGTIKVYENVLQK